LTDFQSDWLGYTLWGIAACWLVVVAVLALRTKPEPEGSTMPDDREQTNVNITSHGQSGGITAQTVHVSAPQPAVHGQVEFKNQPHEGKYHTRARIQLDAPYAAGGLQVVVEGTSISDLSVSPDQTAAMFGVTQYDNKPSSAAVEMQPPLAPRYIADVMTDQPDTLNVRLAIR
jgi:hypothetical protein